MFLLRLVLLIVFIVIYFNYPIHGQDYYFVRNEPRHGPPPGAKDGINCAYLYDKKQYYGNFTGLNNFEHRNLGSWSERGQSVLMKDNCMLTLFDNEGHNKVIEEDTHCLWRWNNKAVASCCECEGCSGVQIRSENLEYCAKLYEEEKCSHCLGYNIEVVEGESPSVPIAMENRISSLVVKQGCFLNVFDRPNFVGNSYRLRGVHERLPRDLDNKISSFRCSCPN